MDALIVVWLFVDGDIESPTRRLADVRDRKRAEKARAAEEARRAEIRSALGQAR